ncbi:MAG: hydrogenase expression/formation protein HypE [Deltaproteobacteria bacterium]|nr:hydrogenase expression/formation protein HypE [Deltaproteobacteria bacterium]
MNEVNLNCPLPFNQHSTVLLSHGGGGKHMRELVENIIVKAFDNPTLRSLHDGAVIKEKNARFAFTTDSYVISPLVFRGGDIGSLSVHGTINDLAMCGAKPLYLSCAFILEEGFPFTLFQKIIQSMQQAAMACDVTIVTGDTKVVERGKADGLYINTAGIGILEHSFDISPKSIQIGDAVILSGDIGRHGIAIMAEREGLSFDCPIESDSAPLWKPVRELFQERLSIHCLRDLTRGGLASALVELASSSGLSIHTEEKAIPVKEEVAGACEILGFDPIYVANEGRFVAFVSKSEADRTVDILRKFPMCENACLIGYVGERGGKVFMKSKIGGERIVDMLSGEQLPRIC